MARITVDELPTDLVLAGDEWVIVHGVDGTTRKIAASAFTSTPTAHASTHAAAGGDPVTLSQSQITGLVAALASKADLVHTHTLTAITDVTASAAELNFSAGVTSAIQTQLNGKAATSHAHTVADITGLTSSVAELNILDGVTATAAELNHVDGVTSAIQTQLDGKSATGHTHTLASVTDVTASAAELNILDGATLTVTELNFVDGVTSSIQTQLNSKQAQDAFLDDIAALTDPGADRILFWDDSAGDIVWLTVGTNLTITGTTLDATGGGGSALTVSQNGTPLDTDIGHIDFGLGFDLTETPENQVNVTLDLAEVTSGMGTLPIAGGGTGATTAGAALTALGAQPLDADLTHLAANFFAPTTVVSALLSFKEGTTNGTSSITLSGQAALASDVTVYLPAGPHGAVIATDTGTLTFSGKTFDLTSNTLVGSVAEFNAALESADFYTTGGTDVALADGGTGASLADPGADRIMFWDDSAGAVTWLQVGTGLAITATQLDATGGGGGGIANVVEDTTPQLGGNLDLNGSTVGDATAADLTKLNAVTATAAELNFVDGVTSAIQTQIDGKQPLDTDLTTIAGLTATTDNFIVSVASAWASRTPAQVRTTLGLVVGTNVQAFDADLTTLASAFISASAAGPASLDFAEDTDNGTNRIRLSAPAAITADVTVTLPGVASTLATLAGTETLTGKTIDLTSNTLVGSVAEFNTALESADFYTSGGTDVAVADGGTGGSDAATARTNLGAAAKAPPINVVAATGATETIDWNTEVHYLTMDQNCTFSFSNVPASGNHGSIVVWLSGAFTATWPAAVDYGDATAPTYTTPSLYVLSTRDGGTSVLMTQVAKAIG